MVLAMAEALLLWSNGGARLVKNGYDQAEIASCRQASLLADILSLLCKSKGPASFMYKGQLR